MLITAQHRDALIELINISFARTAASLSELTGDHVVLQQPDVYIRPISTLNTILASFLPGDLATVQQLFTGAISGNAMLLLNYEGAVELTELFVPTASKNNHSLDSSACEVLTEIGNILLNACLGMFGNLLNIPVCFSAPRLHLDVLDQLINSIAGEEKLSYSLFISTTFSMRDKSVTGYLILLLSLDSLESLVQAVEVWAELPNTGDTSNSEVEIVI
ncbi:MAG: chemotaxis protein CheC [Crinalium sp.]